MKRKHNRTNHGRTVNFALALGLDKDQDKSYDKWSSIAQGMISDFERFQLLSVVLLEKRQIDVEGHSQIPEGVSRYKPNFVSS